MFTQNFEKTAEESSAPERVMGAVGANVGGSVVAGLGSSAMVPLIFKGSDKVKTKDVNKFMREMKKHHDLKVGEKPTSLHGAAFEPRELEEMLRKRRGLPVDPVGARRKGSKTSAKPNRDEFLKSWKDHFKPKKPKPIPRDGYIRRNPKHTEAIVAHELGHAIDFKRMPKKLRKAYMYSRGLGPLAGLVGAGALAASENEKVRDYAPTAVGAGFAPTLWQEGRATYFGTKEIGRQKGWKSALKSLGKTGPAFATYAGVPLVAGGLTKLYMNSLKKKKKPDQTERGE